MTSTTLTSWVLLIWQALQDRGVNAHDIFSHAGLEPHKLSDSTARYPAKKIYHLWHVIEEVVGEETFGIEAGEHWSMTSFHALGFAWLASENLKEALERFVRYGRMTNDSIVATLDVDETTCTFSLSSPEYDRYGHRYGVDASNMALLKMCRLMKGKDFSPIEVRALRPSSEIDKLLAEKIGAPITFGCEKNVWVFDRADAEASLPSANSELAMANDEATLEYLATMPNSDIYNRVQFAIRKMLPSGGVTEQGVANKLSMPANEMANALEQGGFTFGRVLDQVKKDLAKNYVRDSLLTMSEISYLLGFSESASFTRAFKRWFELSPTEYRAA